MKSFLSTTLFICFAISLNAQAPLNYTATDCNANSKTIHTVLGTTNKAVIVLSKGVDCSICVSSAPGWQTWAAQNSSKVEVWGAITYKYNPANFNPPCTATQNWVNNHGWTSIFSFPDNNRDFVGAAMPRYYVYSPQDSSIIYEGPSSSTARSMALQASTVGIQNNELFDQINISFQNRNIQIQNVPANVKEIALFNIAGQVITEAKKQGADWNLNLKEQSTGILLLVLKSQDGVYSKKLFVNSY